MLSVLIDAVLGHHHESLEQLLDVVTKSRGTMGASQVEHRNILDAVAAHDPDAAKDAMTIHLDRLLTDVTQFARRGNAGVVEQILSLVQTPQ
jgi:DNA-binding GntR family transcriptional regulator